MTAINQELVVHGLFDECPPRRSCLFPVHVACVADVGISRLHGIVRRIREAQQLLVPGLHKHRHLSRRVPGRGYSGDAGQNVRVRLHQFDSSL